MHLQHSHRTSPPQASGGNKSSLSSIAPTSLPLALPLELDLPMDFDKLYVQSLYIFQTSKNVSEALSGWKQAMIDKICALKNNETWDLIPLPLASLLQVIVGFDGNLVRLKARLVAKGYTHAFDLDYDDSFSHMEKRHLYSYSTPWLLFVISLVSILARYEESFPS
ncbi:retrovirus-related Pol polyprotein from transposon TNT 1-94 [Trifolium medium]|uniref:Retrovirus-related Pol polyprotein from transposon TNT 1-94 n=1 Tax=Trifolium medium TaxID=97028 RepID=A0A392PT30_9FABA|nr:retrovirus-related Pol polyprotein from transposon TNT 1-94 [Trifolium medium]